MCTRTPKALCKFSVSLFAFVVLDRHIFRSLATNVNVYEEDAVGSIQILRFIFCIYHISFYSRFISILIVFLFGFLRGITNANRRGRPMYSAHEAALMLEDEEFESANIFLVPSSPKQGEFTDEDSGDEECNTGSFNNLPPRQLQSQASVTINHFDGTRSVIDGYESADEDCPAEDLHIIDEQPQQPEEDMDVEGIAVPRHIKCFPDEPKWKKGDLPNPQDTEWQHSKKGQPYLTNPMSPVELFELYFDDDLVEFIVKCTTTYAGQRGDHTFSTDPIEIRAFFGILILSGYNQLPRRRMYWEKQEDVHNKLVSDTMSRNRFDTIFRYLKVCDNMNLDETDKMAKVRSLFSHLNEKFLEFYPMLDRYLSVDESMVPYFGRHSSKQFIKTKPIRFGFKLWRLCSILGYIVQFEPYTGAGDVRYRELGVGGSVVADLLSGLPEYPWHVTFDNYFTNLNLMTHLKDRGIGAVGTLRADRRKGCPIDLKALGKEPRGTFHHRKEGTDNILVLSWNDNNVVTVASNEAPALPTGEVKRWSKAEKKMVNISRPNVIKVYNETMGGVDRSDQNIAAYRISMRQRKWYWPLVADSLDGAIQNAWLLHRYINIFFTYIIDLL